jgi:hypothetical protein
VRVRCGITWALDAQSEQFMTAVEGLKSIFLGEQLTYSTVRITAVGPEGDPSIGTGFLYGHRLANGDMFIGLYTNKHIVASSSRLTLHFLRSAQNGQPMLGQYCSIEITNTSGAWYNHPDPSVDLCAMLVSKVLNALHAKGERTFLRMFSDADQIETLGEDNLDAIEQVMMVGYPAGIWDSVNNRPVTRVGYTASHPAVDFNGKKEFLVDVACFPGSSGSPIVLASPQARIARDGSTIAVNGVKLLGVLFAGPEHTVVGAISVVEIQSRAVPIAQTAIPMNLGFALKAIRVKELGAILTSEVERE